jgi:hypothetical protein
MIRMRLMPAAAVRPKKRRNRGTDRFIVDHLPLKQPMAAVIDAPPTAAIPAMQAAQTIAVGGVTGTAQKSNQCLVIEDECSRHVVHLVTVSRGSAEV